MAKIDKSTKRPAGTHGLSGSREATSGIIVDRKSRDSSAPMLVSVKFMDLRPSMCRWPIGDPRHFEAFRFCGSPCPSEAPYCKKHNAIAHLSNRPRASHKTNFHLRAWVA